MKKTVSLYAVTSSKRRAEEVNEEFYIVKQKYEEEQVKNVLEEAKKYYLHCFRNSYYEGEYDNSWEETQEINENNILLKDGELYGFVFDCESHWTGGGSDEYKDVLYLTDADTHKRISLYSSDIDHGDTMSSSSNEAKLVKRKDS